MKRRNPVAMYVRMWPRELFDCKLGKRLLVKELEVLSRPGIYVLYRNDVPFYIGKAKRLRSRLWSHAKNSQTRTYNFWTHFSAFVVEDVTIRNQLEGVLIGAMPSITNGAKPRIRKAHLPLSVQKQLAKLLHPPIQLKASAAHAGGFGTDDGRYI